MNNELSKRIHSKISINEKVCKVLSIINTICNKHGTEIYLIGGFVRDLLLDIDSTDLDLVLEGDIEVIIEELAKKLQKTVHINRQFSTLKVVLTNGISIDIVSARKEYYSKSGVLPKTIQGSLKDDMLRRDFTINTLGIDFKNIKRPVLIDYFNGLKDIEEKKIRILHPKSFIDDPTRIFRAIRFSIKLDFNIEKHTLKMMNKAINSNAVSRISKDRFFREIMKIAYEDKSHEMFSIVNQYRLFKYISKDDSFFIHGSKIMELVYENPSIMQATYKFYKIDIIKVKLSILLFKVDYEELKSFISRVSISKNIKKVITDVNKDHEIIIERLKKDITNYEIYKLLKGKNEETLISYIYISEINPIVLERINYYRQDISRVKNFVTGKDLLELGIEEGPMYGVILNKLEKEIINNNAFRKKDQILILKKIILDIKEGKKYGHI